MLRRWRGMRPPRQPFSTRSTPPSAPSRSPLASDPPPPRRSELHHPMHWCRWRDLRRVRQQWLGQLPLRPLSSTASTRPSTPHRTMPAPRSPLLHRASRQHLVRGLVQWWLQGLPRVRSVRLPTRSPRRRSCPPRYPFRQLCRRCWRRFLPRHLRPRRPLRRPANLLQQGQGLQRRRLPAPPPTTTRSLPTASRPPLPPLPPLSPLPPPPTVIHSR